MGFLKFLHGQTTERNVKNATARVAMNDLDGLVSAPLQVLFPAIGGWNCFWTPKEGDQVVISRMSNGNSEGHVLGKVYTANKMPQCGAPNIILLVSDDGKNVVRFDADKGTLDLIVDQKGSLKFKNLDIEVIEHTHIKTKTLNMEVEEWVQNEVGGDVDTTILGNVDTAIGKNVTEIVEGKVAKMVGGDHKVIAGGENRDNGAATEHN